MRDTFKSVVFIVGAILLCLFVGCVSPAYAAIPITLTTPGGVCQFQATKVTAVANVFSAEGVWGPGCPGYAAPTPPVSAVDCSKVAPPPGLTRLTRVVANGANLDALKLATLYGAFPGMSGFKTLTLPKHSYLALEFTVPLAMAPKSIGKFSNLSTGTSAPFSETLSPCPGDFRALIELGKGCGLSMNAEGNLSFVIDYAGGNKCNLKPGARYYLNVIHAPLGHAGSSTCSTSECTATIKNAPGQ